MELHVEEPVHLGQQRSEQRHQKGIGLLRLLQDGTPQDALDFTQQVAGFILTRHLLGLQDAIQLGRGQSTHLRGRSVSGGGSALGTCVWQQQRLTLGSS